MQSLDEILWEEVLKQKERLERICALPVKEPQRGTSKALAEVAMSRAYQDWYKHITR